MIGLPLQVDSHILNPIKHDSLDTLYSHQGRKFYTKYDIFDLKKRKFGEINKNFCLIKLILTNSPI